MLLVVLTGLLAGCRAGTQSGKTDWVRPEIGLSAESRTRTGPGYWVSRLELSYAPGGPGGVPAIEELLASEVILVSPDRAEGIGIRQTIRLSDLTAQGPVCLTATELKQIQDSLVGVLNRRGLGAVAVMPAGGQIDLTTLNDLRASTAADPKPLALTIWVGGVRQVTARPAGGLADEKLNPRLARRILAFSPVAGIDPNEPDRPPAPLTVDEIGAYLHRLNRHPGRRVEAAVRPAGEPGRVDLDYYVQQEKPWLLYGQVSNTGTEDSGKWRSRMGLIHNQLTGRDDSLSLDYLTSDFTDLHSYAVSYDTPLPGTLDTRLRLNGARSNYESSDLGDETDFSGTESALGCELSRTLGQQGSLFVDGFAGLDWNRYEVHNRIVEMNGLESMLTGRAGLSVERDQPLTRSYGMAGLSWSMPGISGAGASGLTRLGRVDPDERWLIAQVYVQHSFYLEPVLEPNEWAGGRSSLGTRPAHELAVTLRGQYTQDRLIPQERMALGGMYSVRGYPQSAISGDSAVVASGEYRYHLGSGEPVQRMDRLDRSERGRADSVWNAMGLDDWDCVLKVFCDAGRSVNTGRTGYEQDGTLTSVGLGSEVRFNRRVTIRCELGCPLTALRSAREEIQPGDLAAHVAGMVTF